MRKTAIMLLAFGLAATAAAPAFAVSLMTETFTYANGNLALPVSVSGGNWANHSGVGTDIQVTGAVAVGNMNNAPDDNRSFTAQDSQSVVYACFQCMIPTMAAAPRNNYFAHLKDGGTSNFVTRVFVAPVASTSSFTFGLSHFSGTQSDQWATPLNYGQWYTVVIKYDGPSKTSKLWVDPVNESSTSITTTYVSGPGRSIISSFALRESTGGTGGSPFIYNVDNISVATTFGDLGCGSQGTPARGTTWGKLKNIYR